MKKTLLTILPILLASCGGQNDPAVVIPDTTGPLISISGPSEIRVGETGTYTMNAIDASGVNNTAYWWDLDADTTSDGISTSFDYTPIIADIGTKLLDAYATDTLGNESSERTSITVLPSSTYTVEYIVYDANGAEGAGLYSASKTGVPNNYIADLLSGSGLSVPSSGTLELNISTDIDSDTVSDLDEIMSNYILMNSTDRAIVNPDPTGYIPFMDTAIDSEYTHLIKITRED